MVREKKMEQIASMKSIGLTTKQIALIVYNDDSEEGQKKVRAILSYMKRKGMVNDLIVNFTNKSPQLFYIPTASFEPKNPNFSGHQPQPQILNVKTTTFCTETMEVKT